SLFLFTFSIIWLALSHVNWDIFNYFAQKEHPISTPFDREQFLDLFYFAFPRLCLIDIVVRAWYDRENPCYFWFCRRVYLHYSSCTGDFSTKESNSET